MKNIPMILLLFTPYVIMFTGSWLGNTPYLCGFIPFAVILLFNMVYAFFLPRLGYTGKEILFWNMLLKICNIPAFLGLCFIGFVMLMFRVEYGGLFTCLLAYVLLLSSTMFGVSGLICCYKEGVIPRKTFIVQIFLHFIFFTDVVSAIYCHEKVPNNDSQTQEGASGEEESEQLYN